MRPLLPRRSRRPGDHVKDLVLVQDTPVVFSSAPAPVRYGIRRLRPAPSRRDIGFYGSADERPGPDERDGGEKVIEVVSLQTPVRSLPGRGFPAGTRPPFAPDESWQVFPRLPGYAHRNQKWGIVSLTPMHSKVNRRQSPQTQLIHR